MTSLGSVRASIGRSVSAYHLTECVALGARSVGARSSASGLAYPWGGSRRSARPGGEGQAIASHVSFSKPMPPDPATSLWPIGALMFALSLTLAGCADAPGRIDRNAAHFNYTRIEVRGTDFSHVVYEKLKPIPDRALHVYLEGDGTPWVKERWVAADPTPRNPLMLRLMALDPADSIYVGRPCYHGFARIPPCTPELWTSGRYSREVVESMADVVRGILAKRGSKELCLFGHSGGGALAMLLADQLKSTRAVVTLAGNLDIDAWSHYHRYSPLTRSLNPVGETHLGNQVQQLHLVGSDDRRVPPALLEKAITHWPNAQFRVLEGFSHTCCWERVWPSVLSWVSGKG